MDLLQRKHHEILAETAMWQLWRVTYLCIVLHSNLLLNKLLTWLDLNAVCWEADPSCVMSLADDMLCLCQDCLNEWANMTGFLCALGSVCLQNKIHWPLGVDSRKSSVLPGCSDQQYCPVTMCVFSSHHIFIKPILCSDHTQSDYIGFFSSVNKRWSTLTVICGRRRLYCPTYKNAS